MTAPATDWTPARIKALRKKAGLNQADFAAAMGHSSNVRVSELETGLVSVTGPVARVLDYIEAHGVLPGVVAAIS